MNEVAVALQAARAAAVRIRAAPPQQARQKGAVDWVTEIDLDCEGIIRDILARHTPDIPVLGEEQGGSDAATRWVVDPVDGTTNLVHGFPHVAVSIGLEVAGVPEVGVVVDVFRDIVYEAARGKGARANGQTIHVSNIRTLDQALCATGFAYDRRARAAHYLRYVQRVLECTQDVRRAGAAALDLASVAAGQFDLYWEFSLCRWDVAAGIVLVQEAGGQVCAVPGATLAGDRPSPFTTNGWLHDEAFALFEALRDDGLGSER